MAQIYEVLNIQGAMYQYKEKSVVKYNILV